MLLLRTWIRPWVLLLLPVLASLVAWTVPGEGLPLRGFTSRTDVSAGGVVLLMSWYLWCWIALQTGVVLGRRVAGFPSSRPDASGRALAYERNVLLVLTVLGTIGVAYSVVTAAGEVSVLEQVTGGTANELTYSLGGQAGPATLRYTTAIATPLALFLLLKRRTGLLLAGYNVLLLLINSVFSSRLSVVMAIVVLLLLLVHDRPHLRIRPLVVVPAGAVLFALLGFLNHSRNSGYYRAAGVEDPAAMNAYQMLAYLGSPFQVAFGVAEAVVAGTIRPSTNVSGAFEAVLPTYLRQEDSDILVTGVARAYSYQVDIAENLSTNSVFADVLVTHGWWGLVGGLVTLGFAGFLFSVCATRGVIGATACGVIAYAIAETWRVFLFSFGIYSYLLIALAFAVVVARLVTPPGTTADARGGLALTGTHAP